jgi:heme exporter protein B
MKKTHPTQKRTEEPPDKSAKSGAWVAFCALVERDLKVSLSKGQTPWSPLIYVLCVITLLPFALGPDLNALGRLSGALLWMAMPLLTM